MRRPSKRLDYLVSSSLVMARTTVYISPAVSSPRKRGEIRPLLCRLIFFGCLPTSCNGQTEQKVVST